MKRELKQFDEDLIRGTLVDCPDGIRREFLSFDEEGDLMILAPDLNGKNGVVTFAAEDCDLQS
jgi:hypothetical protein